MNSSEDAVASPPDAELWIRPRPAEQKFSIRIDGVEPSRLEALRQRVLSLLLSFSPAATEVAAPAVLPMAEDPVEGRGVRVGVIGLSTDPVRQHGLHEAILAAATDELGGTTASAAVCVCFSTIPGDLIDVPFEEIRWFVDGVWTPPPSGQPFWRILVGLDASTTNAAILILRDGATLSPPVPRNQALIGLANRTRLGWAKEIRADNLCSGPTATVFQATNNSTPRRMLLDAPNCNNGADTIVFRKPGFLGIWQDVGHFSPQFFWQAFGGTGADFTWVAD